MKRLPAGWCEVALGDVADLVLGKMLDRGKVRAGVNLPYLRNANIRWHSIDTSDLLVMGFAESEAERFSARAGDVLICEGGEPGRAAVYRSSTRLMIQKALIRARPGEKLVAEWLVFALEQAAADGRLRSYFTGSTIKHFPLERCASFLIRLPPPAEQRRLLGEMETSLSRLDAAVASLRRVIVDIGRARASVLQAAVSGRLVPIEAALARSEGRSFEPADTMLRRLLVERRRRWAASGRRGAYADPVPVGADDLPALPEGWSWASLDSLADTSGGLTKDAKRRPVGGVDVPYLRVANVQRGWLDLDEVKTILASPDEIKALRLRRGDVLLNEGGDRDKLGRGWVWKGELPLCLHQNHVFRVRPWSDDVLPEYLAHYANSAAQKYFVREGKQTTNLASISLTKLRALPVAVPPSREQERILAEVDRRLSVLDAIELSTDAALVRADRLRQSILKRAFEGRLAAQDPADEPAEELLRRLREAAPAEPSKTFKPRRRVARAATRDSTP